MLIGAMTAPAAALMSDSDSPQLTFFISLTMATFLKQPLKLALVQLASGKIPILFDTAVLSD
jgi:hypothetical protein